MARRPRILPHQAMLHVIARGNNSVRIFRNRTDFAHFKRTIHRLIPQEMLAIHHYAFMHTHFHWLAWVENTSTLATMMKSILVSYQHYYRRRYDYRGHLWHSRYRAIVIENDDQRYQCARYIELNPVHAGMCSDPSQYPWTSYRYYAEGKSDALIQQIFPPSEINEKYRQFIVAGIDLDYQCLKRRFEKEERYSHFAKSSFVRK